MDQNPKANTNISATPGATNPPAGQANTSLTAQPTWTSSAVNKEAVVQVEQLVKDYGRIQALKGISLTVNKGEIFGLLGQNGAGKTTLIKILLGIAQPTAGVAFLLGEPVGTSHIRTRIGYLPEDHRFPEYHSAASLLDFYGDLLEVPYAIKKQRSAECLEMVGLTERKDTKIRTYSKGMKQRVGIAQAIFHNPDVIFLDEPTDGVDPVGRREIRDVLQTLKEQGKTIFVNSHLLGEVELISDRVMILQKGTVIREGSVESLTAQRGTYIIGLARGQSLPMDEVNKLGYSVVRDEDEYEVTLKDGQSIDPLIDLIRAKGLVLRQMTEKRMTLEDYFVDAVEGTEPGVDKKRRRPNKRERRFRE